MTDDARSTPDGLLLDRVRGGDTAAYEELYRAHLDGARHLARILVGPDAADELVAESFARVLGQLRAGKGPTENFRAYLHVTIRNGYRDGLRAPREAPVSDQPWLFDDAAETTTEEMVEGLDETVAVDALASLPERWRQVLWHVEVEGRKPAEVADLMDLAPRTVSSLAHRAREGLKRAYLDLHAGPAPAREKCQWTHARMSQFARGDLGTRAEQKFNQHLEGCADCNLAFLAVDRVNRKLAAYVLPIALLAVPGGSKGLFLLAGAGAAGGGGGAAAAGSTSAGSGGAASGGGAAGGPGIAIGAAAVVAVGAIAAGALAMTGGESAPHRAAARPAPSAPSAPAAPPAAADAAAPAEKAKARVAAQAVAPVAATPAGGDARPAPKQAAPKPAPKAAPKAPKAAPTPAPKPAPSATCGDRKVCAGPVTLSLPKADRPEVKLELKVPVLPVDVSIGRDGIKVDLGR